MGLFKSKTFPLLRRVKKFFTDPLFFVSKIFSRRSHATLFTNNNDLDKKLVYSLSQSKIPNFSQLKHLKKTLNKGESWLINFLIFSIILNLAWMGFNFSKNRLRVAPIFGGQYTEGLIGNPARINPLYASLNDVDKDISRLIYSSLFRYNESGELVKDLVEDYQISADEKTYTLKIRNNANWHQGEKVTVNDVVFTFEAIKNLAYNSPMRASFVGVEISRIDEQTVAFTLSEKYAPFLDLLTFGIMPESVWGQIAPESASLAASNLKPIGSGPYQFKSLAKDKSGNIKNYVLSANKNYYGQKPYLKEIVFKFYADSAEALNALNENNIEGLGALTRENKDSLITRNSLNFYKLNLPRLKAVFFNQDKNTLLKDIKVRQALSFATPRQEIIDKVMSGDARPVYGPILDNNFAYNAGLEKYDLDLARAVSLLESAGLKKETVTEEEINSFKIRQEAATTSKEVLTAEEKKKIELGAGDWLYRETAAVKNKAGKEIVPAVKNHLIIKLTIIDAEEDVKIAELIQKNWEKIGVKTNIIKVPVKEIQTSAVKPKSYEALLFTEMVGNDPDSYVFWHSTQAGVDGLNLSNYKNEEVDKLLEEGRLTSNRDKRIIDYKKFQELLNNDTPAVFLFSSYYTYVQNKKIKGFAVKSIAVPSDRFSGVSAWYMKMGQRLEW
jgi:peptide/nickel transport system substrate-binding protein